MKKIMHFAVLGLVALLPLNLQADFVESFEDITTLPGSGWLEVNNSDAPSGTYFQGNDAVFPAQSGLPTEYLGVNFASTSGPGTSTISNWMIMPEDVLQNGGVLSFFTRTVTGSTFPDRLEVRMSTNGASTDVGTGPAGVGDFTDLLLSINPNLDSGGYPDDWAQFNVTLSGLTGSLNGRLAFRYFVENGGPAGANSNYIGIDSVSFTSVPEPTTALVLAGFGMGACFVRRRRG